MTWKLVISFGLIQVEVCITSLAAKITWHRAKYVSCQKYEKEVRLSDNLEKVVNPYHNEWVVKYVYKQDRLGYDDLIFMEIGKPPTYQISTEVEFKVTEVKVVRVTEKMIFVSPHFPITYLSSIEKRNLLCPKLYYGRMYAICMADDYDKLEQLLFNSYSKHLWEELLRTQGSLKKLKEQSEKFEILRSKYGHQPTKPKRTK